MIELLDSTKVIMKSRVISHWVHSLVANASSKKEAERRLAQMGIGMVSALRDGEMSLEQSQTDFFNLDTFQAVRKHRLNGHLVEFLQWGMELEDVAELAPEGLEESYQGILRLARHVILESLPKPRVSLYPKRKPRGKRTKHSPVRADRP